MKIRQIIHEVVERFQLAICGILKKVAKAALGFAGKERDADLSRTSHVGVAFRQHRDCPRDMKTADGHHNPALAQRSSDVECSRKLIRLHAYEHHHACIRPFYQCSDAIRSDARVGFVERMDL